ncbi:DinB family protein [Mycolicibacter longobardus]|uniref:Serine/arginine repetitive matrix protein 1 n=1 Tax=Mycolicibacter longobardus TaxID=1108812 RepID=A0A1X1YCH9_9MYCO|nr:DinB family protein [Mycolicibacter longobardus]MCV7386287.1 DinB family protein [Mycolicibacter longobardus]ORW08754.1 serine/arginine repetitive matrix protein 1 [Mycolicibacter longobardus]
MPVTSDVLADQLDWHWQHLLRPRLDGLSDDEYLWEPVPDCWNVRPGRIDFAFPSPVPAPFTTIAWRMTHITVGVFAMRNHHHFAGPPADYDTWPYALDAATALHQLDDAYARWIAGVRGLDEPALARPIGPAEGPWADHTMAQLVLHIHREAIHHGAEIACLRDLYVHRTENFRR